MSKSQDLKPKGENELTSDSLMKFKVVYSDIKSKKCSIICPVYCKNTIHNCEVCVQAFPKDGFSCPCHSNYSKEYLLRRIKEIIKTGKI